MKRAPLTVGIIANPASGRDVRRLTANAGLFSSTDKVSVIQRLLAAVGATGKVLVVVATAASDVAKSMRNLADVHVVLTTELNAYDVLCSDWVVFSQDSLPATEGGAK